MRKVITGAGALAAAALVLGAVPATAQAAANSAGHREPRYFQCRQVGSRLPSHVLGLHCAPALRHQLYRPLMISGYHSRFRCRNGFAESPQYVRGDYCERR